MAMSDRIALRRDRRIKQVGTLSDLRNHPALLFEVQFFGSRKINPLTGARTQSLAMPSDQCERVAICQL